MAAVAENRFWIVPNILSLSRLMMIPVWWWVMVSPAISDWWGGAIILWGIVSDIADGYLARRLNQVTTWGKVLDPVGDKLAALVVGLFCIIYRDLPTWAFGLALFRDLALIVGGWFWYRKRGTVPTSVDLGRYAALLWEIVLLSYAFDWQPVAGMMLWPVLALYLAAGIVYLRVALKSPLSGE